MSVRSCRSIAQIAKALPLEISESRLMDEWKLMQLENICVIEKERIDHYWQKIFILKNGFGEPKYPTITKVVKASLTLAHGSADIERGFSTSGRVLTPDKASMSVETLNAKLFIKDGLRRFNNRPERVPITAKLLTSAQLAYSKYKEHLEKKKREKEDEERKKQEKEEEEKARADEASRKQSLREDIGRLEEEVKKARKIEESQKKAAVRLLDEASDRLKNALKRDDLEEAKLAQGMLEGAQVLQKGYEVNENKADNLQRKLEKRKSVLITSFFKKPRKNLK